jgi:hypothetical protein
MTGAGRRLRFAAARFHVLIDFMIDSFHKSLA